MIDYSADSYRLLSEVLKENPEAVARGDLILICAVGGEARLPLGARPALVIDTHGVSKHMDIYERALNELGALTVLISGRLQRVYLKTWYVWWPQGAPAPGLPASVPPSAHSGGTI